MGEGDLWSSGNLHKTDTKPEANDRKVTMRGGRLQLGGICQHAYISPQPRNGEGDFHKS